MTRKNSDRRVYSRHGRTVFVHVEMPGDLGFQKVKFWSGKRVEEQVEGDSVHYIDFSDMTVMIFEILQGLEKDQEIVSYKGKVEEGSGKVISRIMKIKRDRSEEDKYFVIVGHGPGKEVNGIVEPVKNAPREAWTFTPVPFDSYALRDMCLTIQREINAYTVAKVLKEVSAYE